MSTFTTPIINLKPTNPTSEDLLNIQKFGLQPYDRTPNDYLRFVAKIFTAWRDPNDNILNYDPFDDKYGVSATTGATTTTLQATADKSIIAYVDGFETQYNFVRLTTDAASTDLTQTSVSNPTTSLESYTSSNGDIITIDKSKYGEYHRFQIKPGICFIDNQLIQITEETTWWFRIPELKAPISTTGGVPTFELGQFIVDPLKVYSLLPNKNYKIILSYEYVNQFESNVARLRFETDDTAIDEPYLLIASFSTNDYGIVHQTLPINESSIETFKYYVIKEDIDATTGLTKNYYYLKDINPQYLDKKYMANHKNLFKHLQTQLLTTLSDSKISNTFHCRTMTENIHPSCSSGDMVYYDGTTKTWYPAEVSRQDFDKVTGLYLKNANEGTDVLFTSGIIEIDDTYVIMDSENMVLKNLIPGAEYFLAEDTGTALNTAPFIDTMVIIDQRDTGTDGISGIFSVSTEVIAKASSITLSMEPTPTSGLANFSLTRTFDLNPVLGEQRIPQTIYWEFTADEKSKLPNIKFESTLLIKTDKVQFQVSLNMVKSTIEETREEVIENFKLTDKDIIIDIIENKGTPSETTIPVTINESTLYIKTNGLPDVLLAKGPTGSPIMKLLEAFGTKAKVDYPAINILKDGYFSIPNGNTYKLVDIQTELTEIKNKLNLILYSEEYTDLGFNKILSLLGTEVTNIDTVVSNLNNALTVLQDNYKAASLVFQSQESDLQLAITEARNQYTIAKDTYDHLNSDIFTLTQKRNAVDAKIMELALQIQDLKDAKAALATSMIQISTAITNYTNEINRLNTEIQANQAGIDQCTANINTCTSNMLTLLNNARAQENGSFNFDLNYWNIVSTSVAIDFNDITRSQPRLLNSFQNIYNLIQKSESSRIGYLNSKKAYEDANSAYTTNVLNGTLTYAEQLAALDNIANLKLTYDNNQSMYQGYLSNLSIARDVKDLLLSPLSFVENNPWGELFSLVTPNTDPNSAYGNSELTKFTILVNKPFNRNIEFEFIYKEDTHNVLRLTLPAGQTTASIQMYLQSISDTYIDAGVPSWIAYEQGTNTPVQMFNMNKFNQMLMDDATILNNGISGTGNNNAKDLVKLYTLDKTQFASNPITSVDASLNKKPVQTGSLIRSWNELWDITNTIQGLINTLTQRDQNIFDLDNFKSLLTQNQNLLVYNQNGLDAVTAQKQLGQTTTNVYDNEISYLENRKLWFKTTTDIITEADLVGSDLSYDVCNAKIIAMNQIMLTVEANVASTKIAYEKTLSDLSIATNKALGKFTDGIAETNRLITLKQDEKLKINVMFSLYSERLNILNNIFVNISGILESGIFSGEWSTTDTFLLNKFEYQDAMENQLIQIIDDTVKLPISSIIVPKILKYTIGTNGLQYPMDLQPWIFVKTSGKISTKNYPGATSIGTALNQNTLLLNIQHRPTGDISEFLNVYGNENDFNDQLIAKYKSEQNSALGIKIGSTIVSLNKNISDLNSVLVNNPTSVSKVINGKAQLINTNLTNDEITILDNLVATLLTGNENSSYESPTSIYKKEFLLRLVYSKFYGSKASTNSFNPFEYLLAKDLSTNSKSSWYDTVGNIVLNTDNDPFNPTETGGRKFKDYIQFLYNSIGGTSLNETTLKNLFYKKVSLYKDLDIINYILMILPEPTVDYNAKLLQLKNDYKLVLQYKMNNSRYILSDNPTNPLDDFENPDLTDEDISSRASTTASTFQTLITNNNNAMVARQNLISDSKVSHDQIISRMAKYHLYKQFYMSLRNDIQNAIDLLNSKLSLYNQIKTELTAQLKVVNATNLSYYNKMNKLPNVMWDIFRITNSQRTKWNYTYMVLRILGMQKELNDVVVGKTIQYSPINAELTELTIKKNAALTAGEQTNAYAYDLEIKALEQKKLNFYNILSNIINEFNVIQQKYAKPTITPETALTSDKIINELYMQNPDDYNLSYAFAPYPMYKEI